MITFVRPGKIAQLIILLAKIIQPEHILQLQFIVLLFLI